MSDKSWNKVRVTPPLTTLMRLSSLVFTLLAAQTNKITTMQSQLKQNHTRNNKISRLKCWI